MKKTFLVLFFLLFLSENLLAQIIVANPGSDALISVQTSLIAQLSSQSDMREIEHFTEYLSQFAEIIGTIKKSSDLMKKIAKIGDVLKNKSAKEWLADVDKNLSGVFPEYSKFKNEVGNEVNSKISSLVGKYSGYVAKWDKNLKDYHEKLIENYEDHVMFPELFPSISKIGKNFSENESAKKIIHKAWRESGLEYEMKNDVVRKNTFKNYYGEYLKQAKENENIEAVGLANIMQSQYLMVETIEHIKKNFDLNVMKEQFQQDAANEYLNYRKLLEKDEKSKNRPTKRKTIFGLEK